MPRLYSRRRFFNTTTVLAGSAYALPNLLLKGRDAAGKRLRLAQIGANGKGAVDTGKVTLEHEIVAMVDVDSSRLDEAAKRREDYHKKAGAAPANVPKMFADFRKMFDEMAAEIDGVIVSTPDHTHFLAAMWAIKHGKHVCVQKPLCNTIWEVRELHKAAKQRGVVTQMGNQGRTYDGQRLAKEWIEQGRIGTLKEVKLWTNRPIWPQGPIDKILKPQPENLNWDLWLSCTPSEPYFEFPVAKQTKRSNGPHPFAWRGWWQWGAGALGDMGCHVMDATFSILSQVIPTKIEVESDAISELCAPNWTTLKYHMPASARHPAMVVTWQDGSKGDTQNKPEKPDLIKQDTWDKAKSGMLFIGTDGIVFEGDAYCEHPRLYPEEKFTQARADIASGKHINTEARCPTPDNPQLDWANGIVNGTLPVSNFDYSAALTEFVLLGNLALRSQQAITWDRDAMKVTNIEEANRYVKRASYRDGWI